MPFVSENKEKSWKHRFLTFLSTYEINRINKGLGSGATRITEQANKLPASVTEGLRHDFEWKNSHRGRCGWSWSLLQWNR